MRVSQTKKTAIKTIEMISGKDTEDDFHPDADPDDMANMSRTRATAYIRRWMNSRQTNILVNTDTPTRSNLFQADFGRRRLTTTGS
jgi:hypothetical protein